MFDRDYRWDKQEIDVETIEFFVLLHRENEERFNKLENEYKGLPEILEQAKKEMGKPDNRIVVSHGRYMVDMFDGFFIGKAVKVVSEREKAAENLHAFAKRNSIDDHNAELAKIASIYGYVIELIYQDEDSESRVAYLTPKNAFIVYDASIQRKKLFGVYYYDNKITVYTATEIIEYERNSEGKLVEQSRIIHPFGAVPMIKYLHNEEEIGLYEPAMTMINHYNKALSEKANDVDYFADAYFYVTGIEVEKKMIEKIRDSRFVNPYAKQAGKEVNIQLGFLEKPNADVTQENLLNRLEKKIFQMCKVTDLTDERFGNATGVAKEMKLQDMSNQAIIKERKFQEALDERYRLFFSIPTNGTEEDWLSLKYTFYRNLPRDLEREAGLVSGLKGIVSDSTLLSQLSFVDDVQEELKMIEEDRDGREGEDITRFAMKSEAVVTDEK